MSNEERGLVEYQAKDEIPYGYCRCGCGEKTKIPTRSTTKYGWVKGVPLKYILGHTLKGHMHKRGPDHHNWKGGRKFCTGYIQVLCPDHPRADSHGYVYEHILIAEKVLGRFIPRTVEVHHVNENRADNRNQNLVICNDSDYHKLIHKRMRERVKNG